MAKADLTWRRMPWAAAVVGLLLGAYVGSYAALYRRGVAEAERYGYDFFFYVPFADVVAARDTTARHQWLGPVYSPLNELHGRWLGGRPACKCVMVGLSAEPPEG